MRRAARALILFFLIGAALGYAAGAIRESRRLHQLGVERDIEAAASLKSFRAHEKLQQIIPEYRPASKPLPGQRDA